MRPDEYLPGAEQTPERVVAIGASAGGVEAFSRLLQALPAKTGFAYLIIPHLSPTHSSQLAELLARSTAFPVTEAREGERLLPDQGYVLPPNRVMRVVDGRVKLEPRPARDGLPTVIDACLASVAEAWGSRAVGVILSGTGSDGATGLQAIRAHGGLTYVQDFASATYAGMPRSAVEAGGVDFTLPPEAIGQALGELAETRVGEDVTAGPPPMEVEAAPDVEAQAALSASDSLALETILGSLMKATGVDFRHYKRPSMARRIRRRIEDLELSDLTAYARRLQEDPTEIQILFSRVLIHVTGFFREPAMFDVLQSAIIPSLLTDRPAGTTLRVWVVGCATGEEAYSTAITFMEVQAALRREVPVKIFASDLSADAIATARIGRYPAEISHDISPERLRRFFLPVDGGFQVDKTLREMCVFAQQDITRDPPFANLDLVICRNLLIYLEPVLQHRALHAIHYALKPGGFLALGAAETVSGQEQLFATLDRKNKVYLRRTVASRLDLDFGWRSPEERALGAPWRRGASPAPVPWSSAELRRAAAHVFLAHSPVGSVIVNAGLEIRHFEGRTSPYLEPPPGGPTTNLLKMAHPDLRLLLGRLLRKAQKDHREVRRRDVRIQVGSQPQHVSVSVFPVPTDETDQEHYLVVFEPLPGSGELGSSTRRQGGAEGTPEDPRSLELEQELAETREYLSAIVEQQDETHAELQAAYEASLSANEEFQSTNEELESTKEELQSVNEELTTVNEQLQQRNTELSARASEISGLLEAMDMPIFLLNPELRIQAFNARAAGELRLARTHVGRRITELQAPLPLTDLRDLVDRAFAEHAIQERELQDRDGRWYSLRIWPVTAAGGRPAAVVAALVDIGRLKRDLDRATEREAFHVAVVETVSEPLIVLRDDLKVRSANRAFCAMLKLTQDQVIGARLWDLDEGLGRTPDLHALMDRLLQTGQPFEKQEVILESPRFGKCVFLLSGRRIVRPDGSARDVLLAMVDITRRRAVEEQMIAAGRMQAVGQLAGGVAHEINNQMTSVLGFADLLSKSARLTDDERADFARIVKAAGRAADITRQLLAFSRRQVFAPSVVDLNALVATSESLLLRALGDGVSLEIRLGEDVGQVRVDQAQFEQILVNLASNARDAMSQEGEVILETASVTVSDALPLGAPAIGRAPRGVYARLMFRDNGAGMSEETVARVFEPFFTTKPQGLGTGLGLASVYGTVKQCGGYIWVESRPGRGTTFTIDLPRAVAGIPVKAPTAPSVAPGGAETILVVEDEESVRLWLARALEPLGYAVLLAADGEEALRLVRSTGESIAIAVVDAVLPGMGCGPLLVHLAEIQPALPVILMSAYGTEELYARGIVPRGATVLRKPFDIAELSSQIRRLVDAPAEPSVS
jgi:two-component system CheB/CheR fusion protein